jgi:cyanophycin synthetase
VQEELLETFVEPMRNRNPGGKSSIHILRGAMASDIPFVHVGGARYCLGWGSRCVVIHRSGMSGDSRIGAAMAQSKSLGTRLLRQAGLPAPQNVLVENVQQALDAANTLGWPVVIKPDDRDRGEGVTTDIHDEAALNTAFDAARKLSQKVLVEEQLRGICHRVAIVHGRLLYAVTRFPKRVLGDGVSSIRQLVEKANEAEMAQPPWNRKKPWPLDGLADAELQRQGLNQGSIPMAGRWVTLRPRESSEWGGDATDITDSLHPANVSLCERAARLFGLDVAGIDFMSEDPTLPWHENEAAINEVNFAPLMGGGEASRTRLPELWRRAFPAGARIPVFAVIGNAAARPRAEAIRQWRSEMGERCCLTDHEHTLGADGSPLAVSAEGLFQRCRALLLDRQVDSLVLVVHNDELLRTGSPVDRYSAVEDLSAADPGDALNKDLANHLLGLLAPMQAPGLEAH